MATAPAVGVLCVRGPASNIAVVVLIGGVRPLFGCEVSHLVIGSVVLSAGQGDILPPRVKESCRLRFDGCGISLIGDVEVLDCDRRTPGLAYAPEASRRGKDGSEVVLGIFPCRPGWRDA
jgi:hypothetical protein